MNHVEPIRDLNQIKKLKEYAKKKNLRDYCMICFGLNSALRISDILKLKWKDVLNADYSLKEEVKIYEKKTGKYKQFIINDGIEDGIIEYLTYLGDVDLDDYIFKSREGENKPITREMAWRIIKQSCEAVGIKQNIGTHTLRKTWGYWQNKNNTPLSLIMEALNHSNPKITKRYLGITQDEINNIYKKVVL